MENPEQQRGVAWAFWARVDKLRLEAGMTVVELSSASGVRRQTFMQMQHTTRRPRRDLVLALAAAVKLDPDEALSLAGLSPIDADTVRRMINVAHDLSGEQRASLLALLDVYDAEEHRIPQQRSNRSDRRRLGVVHAA